MKILVAQADILARGMLESVLTRWGYDVILAENGVEAIARLKEQGGPSVAILERELPGPGGLEICKEIRATSGLPYIYLLLVTGEGREQEVMEGLQAGADDFLSSPLSADELMIRLRVAKRILELQGELHRAQAAISYQTTHDPLTGLANRAEVINTLRREMSRVRREGGHIGLILAGLDGLKAINDSHGHAAGDAVLRETARRIRSVVRPYDTVGRYTGEEFLVVAPGCDSKTALTQADRLRATVAQTSMDLSEWGKFTSPRESKLPVTISLSVAAGDHVTEPEAFLRGVEAALRRAKQAGPNRVEAAREADFN